MLAATYPASGSRHRRGGFPVGLAAVDDDTLGSVAALQSLASICHLLPIPFGLRAVRAVTVSEAWRWPRQVV